MWGRGGKGRRTSASERYTGVVSWRHCGPISGGLIRDMNCWRNNDHESLACVVRVHAGAF